MSARSTDASYTLPFAPSMAWLIGLRVLQGAAMGAVVTCARAIVRDLYNPIDGAPMSKGLSGLGVIHLIFMLGHGIHQPCGQSGAIGSFPKAAGTASALNGFSVMLVAFCTGTRLTTHRDDTTHPLTYGVAAWSAVIALVAWTAVQRQGRSA